MRRLETQRLQASRLIAEFDEEFGQSLAEDLTCTLPLHVRDVDSERLCGGQVTVWVRRTSVLEHGGRGHRDGDTVGNDVLLDVVAGVLVARVLRADGVAHAVAEMDTSIAETDTGQGGGEKHLGLGLEVIRVLDGARQIFDGVAESLQGEDVADGVGALVCGALDRVLGAGCALMEWDGRPAFETVAQNIEAGGGVDGRRHCSGVDGVADSERGFHVAVGNAGLRFLLDEVEDGSASGLRSGAGGGGHGDQRLEFRGHRLAFSEGCVDKVEEVRVWECRVKVHEFRRVNDAATTHCKEGIALLGFCPLNGFLDPSLGVSNNTIELRD